jgi:hypothetical protein
LRSGCLFVGCVGLRAVCQSGNVVWCQGVCREAGQVVGCFGRRAAARKKGIRFLEWTVTFLPSNNRRQARWVEVTHISMQASVPMFRLVDGCVQVLYYRVNVSRDWVVKWTGE